MDKRLIFLEQNIVISTPVEDLEKDMVLWNIVRTIMYNCSKCYILKAEPSNVDYVSNDNSLFLTKQLLLENLSHVKISQNKFYKGTVGNISVKNIKRNLRVSDIEFVDKSIKFNDDVLWDIESIKTEHSSISLDIKDITMSNAPGRQLISFTVNPVNNNKELHISITTTGMTLPDVLLKETLKDKSSYETHPLVMAKVELFKKAYGENPFNLIRETFEVE